MLEFLSPVLSVVGAIGAVVSLRGYFSTRNVERNKPRKDLIAALGELRDDLVDLSSRMSGIPLKQAAPRNL